MCHSQTRRRRRIVRAAVIAILGTIFAIDLPLIAQTQPPASTSTPAAGAPDKPTFKQEELDQMLAPIALYPDPVLSQVLMASTYPLEIVQANRWLKQNKTLKGDALADALEKQPWDPSVKSLIQFPDVMQMLDDKIDNTIRLGDAFLGQQQQVMETVQKLRGKAKETGNLETNKQQVVTVQAPAAGSQQQVIVIEPTDPQVIYVPTYNPTIVYGTWSYPAYPPYYYYPPSYPAQHPGLWFGAGLAIGVAWGYAWGNCNWGHNDVNININRNTNINNRIDRTKYNQNNLKNGQGNWQHNPAHRDGVAYRDNKTAQKFGGQTMQNSIARDSYRGRADAGRADLNRGGVGTGGVGGAGDWRQAANNAGRTSAMQDNRAGVGNNASGIRDNRAGSNAGNRYSGTSDSRYTGTRSNAFDGVDRGGNQARTNSQRGQASRSSGNYRSSGAARSGGGASRGGGARGGGGGRGGGGRR